MGHVTVVGDSLAQAQARLGAVMGEALSEQQQKLLGSSRTGGVAPTSALGGTAEGAKTADVAIIMGSDSDLPVMKAAAQILDSFGVSYEVGSAAAIHCVLQRLAWVCSPRLLPPRGWLGLGC